jgi:hypothetical protein
VLSVFGFIWSDFGFLVWRDSDFDFDVFLGAGKVQLVAT